MTERPGSRRPGSLRPVRLRPGALRPGALRPSALRPSARSRIVGWMLLLVMLALAGSVLVVQQVVRARVSHIVTDRLTHAAQNFSTFATSPSGRSQATTADLLTRYLRDTVPNSGETSFSVLDGAPHRRTADTPPVRLDRDPAFVRTVAAAQQPRSGHLDTADGRAHYAVLPVSVVGDSARGSLVVVVFERAVADPLESTVRDFVLVGLVALVLAGLASWLLAGRVLAPVRVMRQTAEQIGQGDLRRRIPVTGNDDVARLGTTFNRMLDRLQEAFATQRRFLDDAGHELRTPLTVVRGHLELLEEDPVQRRHTLGLVMDELDRMNRIVDELLVMAKAEQPDFVVLGEVTVPDLVVDVLAKARMLAPRTWVVDELADVVVLADGQRLTQALMQLASNAVQHTGTGDRVAVGSRVAGDRLLLWVADSGPGVAPEDATRIFERFQRGSAGLRSGDGAGLGLAIVRSIAVAHGGTAGVSGRPGHGARFTLDLPLRALSLAPTEPGGFPGFTGVRAEPDESQEVPG